MTTFTRALTLCLFLIAIIVSQATALIGSITPAPIAPDGNVAGRATDLVVNFDIPFDPQVPGRTLMKGKTIQITLPEAFVNTGKLPLKDWPNPPDCKPLNVQCNTGILLQGWPQRPIRPPFKKYKLSLEGTHTLVYTALQDLVPTPPLEPGIKQSHMILLGFRNPSPGMYPITVVAQTGPNGATETGTHYVEIVPQPQPKIDVTNALFKPKGVSNYQAVSVSKDAPRPFDLLLWDHEGKPFEGVKITNGALMKGEVVVGNVSIVGPQGASGSSVAASEPSVQIKAPVHDFRIK